MAKARGASVRRRVRHVGGRLMRRVGLVPGGVADGLGDDEYLLGTRLPHAVMVFFPDPPGSLYQLRQWYSALRALDRRHRVVIVLQDSRTARVVRRECDLDAVVIARYTTTDDLLSRSDVKVALYVNHNPENFSNLRFTSMVHASLMHGDSDKQVTVSNLTKAYDFSLVAGRAAVDRMSAFSTFYDARSRCIPIGRPQLEEQLAGCSAGPRVVNGQALTVLYAPTWEGPQPSAAYGSVDTHGVALVEAMVADGWTVVYRPHPLTGAQGQGPYAEADQSIRTLLAKARDASHPHRVDADVPIATSFADADLLVSDISGIAIDWLAMDRPLMITKPARSTAAVATSPLTTLVPAIAATDIADLPRLAREQVTHDPLRDRRRELVAHYLGDVGAVSTAAPFVAAVDRMIEVRDCERARLKRLRTSQPGLHELVAS